MFHAGVVAPSSVLLLQLLTPPVGDFVPPLTEDDSEFENRLGLVQPPALEVAVDATELVALVLLVPRGRLDDAAFAP